MATAELQTERVRSDHLRVGDELLVDGATYRVMNLWRSIPHPNILQVELASRERSGLFHASAITLDFVPGHLEVERIVKERR
jgi:hypothetical protein